MAGFAAQWRLALEAGKTLKATLNYTLKNSDNLLQIEIMTGDDWTEGTEVFPSVENGFSDLFAIQRFGVQYNGQAGNPVALVDETKKFVNYSYREVYHQPVPANVIRVIAEAEQHAPAVAAEIETLKKAARSVPKQIGARGKLGLPDNLQITDAGAYAVMLPLAGLINRHPTTLGLALGLGLALAAMAIRAPSLKSWLNRIASRILDRSPENPAAPALVGLIDRPGLRGNAAGAGRGSRAAL